MMNKRAWAGCGLALSLLVGCQPDRDDERTKVQLLTSSCQAGTTCEVTLPIASQIPNERVALFGKNGVVVGPRVTLRDASGAPGAIANTESGRLEIGASGRVGALWSGGDVFLGSQSRAAGDVRAVTTIVRQAGAIVEGQALAGQPAGSLGALSWSVAYPSTNAGDVRLEPDQVRSLEPGAYGALAAKDRSRVKLRTGTYFFESWQHDSTALIDVDNTAGTVVIYVRSGFSARSAFSYSAEPSDAVIVYFGDSEAQLESAFAGSFVAPHAKIKLGRPAAGQAHRGQFFGKTIQLDSDATLNLVRPSSRGPAVAAIAPAVTLPASAVPAPAPPSMGATPEETFAILGSYIDGLVDSGYTGPTVQLPSPSWGVGREDTSLSTLFGRFSAQLAQGRTASAKSKKTPAPPVMARGSTNERTFYEGDPLDERNAFDGAWEISGRVDANTSGELGFFTDYDFNVQTGVRFFGVNANPLIQIKSFGETATEKVIDGEPTPVAEASFQLFLAGIQVVDKKFDELNLYEENLYEETAPLGPQLDYPVPPFGSLVAGLEAEVGLPLALNLRAEGPTLGFHPFFRIYVKVGFDFGVVVTLGIEGQLDLIRIDAPLDLNLRWAINEAPDVCAATIQLDSTWQVKWSTVNGKILLTFKIKIPLLFTSIEIDLAEVPIVEWEGESLETPKMQIFETPTLDFDLDPAKCSLGTMSCAEEAVPNPLFESIPETPFQTVMPPYGQEACQDQAVFGISSLVLDDFEEILVSALWSTTIGDEVPCNTRRRADLVIFTQDLAGEWHEFERIEYIGRLSGDTCTFDILNRTVPLPDDVADLPNYGWVHVPTQSIRGIRAAVSSQFEGQLLPVRVGIQGR